MPVKRSTYKRPRYQYYQYFEEYACGCVSGYEQRKRDLLGYCPVHGEGRRSVYPVPVSKGAKRGK